MAGTPKRLFGPVALINTYTTDIFTPPASTIYSVLTHLHVVNKTAGAVSFRLYLGATGGNVAGTELYYDYSVAANSCVDFYGALVLKSTDFLVGGASANTSLVITGEGYQVVVP